ncbi:MAG TPA: DNA polymerase I [Tepidisphaeraceae bacterium]|nr:DNA polymerase I [Tepidisphaeraceae bacterium]
MAHPTFYIIDGHAQIYRAYYAPFRDLTSPTGEPTKATFVFTQRLLNLIQQKKPDYLAMVIDTGEADLLRKQFYPEYKANRKPAPDDFHPQEERILQIVRDIGIPIFFKVGYEADDVIATLAKKLCDRGFDILLVSNDKDLRQLINDCTSMYDPYEDIVTDAAALMAKHGYTPRQAIEVQTLIGDSTDNVPGIPGVGPKTAVKLIQQYGTADAVLDHLDELTPKMRENFKANAALLWQSRKLVTLHTDVEMDFDPESCKFNGINLPALKPHLEELGFHNLLQRIMPQTVAVPTLKPLSRQEQGGLFDQVVPAPATDLQTAADCSYHLVQTEEQFQTFLAQLRAVKKFAFDTETDALGGMESNLIGMSFSWQAKTGYYVPVRGPSGSEHLSPERALRDLRPILEDPTIAKVGHNLKYDALVMRQAGVNLRGIALDTMIAAFLLDSSRMQYGIDRLALELLHFKKVPTSDLIGKGSKQISMVQVDLQRVGAYAAEDADIAWRLAELLEQRLAAIPELKKLADELETPLIDVLVEMEANGIAIDPAILKEQSAVLAERIDKLRIDICREAGVEFNCDSPKQLADVLFNKLHLQKVKRTKTGTSTDVEVLEKLADLHAVPKLVLDYRSLVKLKNTYLDNLTQYLNPVTHRVHASFNQTGAATGRLSCSDPNLQNIPIRTDEGRRIRLAVVPGDREKNVLLTADYSQIELRLLAHFTQEPALLKAFAADEDIHRAVAAEIFGVPPDQVTRQQRASAKTINFAIIYGSSAAGIARRIEGMTVQAAQKFINAYHARFPSIQQFLQRCVMEAQGAGYVTTILGRRRHIPEISSGVINLRNQGERQAINSVVQGSAADLIKEAMLKIHRRLKSENHPSRMLLQVHDELVFETPLEAAESEAAMIRAEMTAAMQLKVPLKVEMGWGKNWQEVK